MMDFCHKGHEGHEGHKKILEFFVPFEVLGIREPLLKGFPPGVSILKHVRHPFDIFGG